MRSMASFLCATTLLYSTGCWSTFDRAEHYRGRAVAGMSAQELFQALGPPDFKQRDATGEMWVYRFESGAGVLYWTIVVSISLVVLGVLICSGSSGGGSWPMPVYQFRVHLGPLDRVDWVSETEDQR